MIENRMQINKIEMPEKWSRIPIFDLNKQGEADRLKEFEFYVAVNKIQAGYPLCIIVNRVLMA